MRVPQKPAKEAITSTSPTTEQPPVAAEAATDTPDPDPGRGRRNRPGWLRPRTVAAVGMLAVVVWYLFVAETAADNNVWHGVTTLFDGIVGLPGLVGDTASYRSWWDFMANAEGFGSILGHVVDHIQLVGASMLFAGVISVALGVLVHRVTPLWGPVLGVASILLTIPSLALFAIFISVPWIGIGDRGPIIALAMYSILPILRNTVLGLDQVDAAVVESAKGMGLPAWRRLTRIEMPLAWPIILTGIRVATLLNIGIAAIAVLVGGTGLGHYINDGLQRFPDVTSVERMWTGVAFTIALALVADLGFTLLRRFTTSKGLR
ncbi:MAG: ABC transporter permease [Acidimicrobiales bacterium]